MQLSEELRDQIDQQISAREAAAHPLAEQPLQPVAPSNAVIWRGAIQIAGLAGAVAAALAVLSFALPPVTLLSLFWFISAPIIGLGVYTSRFHKTRITTGFGARLGLLTGLAILLVTSTLNTIGLVLQRFVFHSTSELDSQIDSSVVNRGFDQGCNDVIRGGGVLSRMQSGLTQHYLRLAAGAVAMLIIFLLWGS